MGTHIIHAAPLNADTRNVLDAVRRIVRSIRVASRAAEKNVGVSAAQLFVLQRLALGEPASLNELAERTLTHQSSASVVVTRLVDRGLIQRTRSPNDARRLELSLTPKAMRLLKRAPDLAQDRLILALQQMPDARVKRLGELLSEFVRTAGLQEQPPMLFEEESKLRGLKRPKERNVRTSR